MIRVRTAHGSATLVSGGDGDGGSNVVWIFIITGQSLSVGCAAGNPTQTPYDAGPVTGHYQNDNLQDDPRTGVQSPPSTWTLVAPHNPMRLEDAGGIYWPYNVWYESPHVGAARRFEELGFGATGWINVGYNGQPYSAIKKGGTSPSYDGSLDELTEMCTKLIALGKTPKVGGIIGIHGESDNGNADYGPVYIPEFQSDYDADCKAITGQTEDIPYYFTQPSAGYPTTLGSSSSINDQMLAAHNGTTLVLAGAKYALPYIASDFHLSPEGTWLMGKMIAEAIYAHKNGGFSPLRPSSAVKTSSTTIQVTFTGSGNGSLTFDTAWWDSNHSTQLTEWADGKGFEVSDNSGRLTITDATISGNVVTITTSTSIGTSPVCSYAHTIDGDLKTRRGQLRTTSGNWCCHFSMSVT